MGSAVIIRPQCSCSGKCFPADDTEVPVEQGLRIPGTGYVHAVVREAPVPCCMNEYAIPVFSGKVQYVPRKSQVYRGVVSAVLGTELSSELQAISRLEGNASNELNIPLQLNYLLMPVFRRVWLFQIFNGVL